MSGRGRTTMSCMRIDARDTERFPLGRAEVDLSDPPPEVSLDNSETRRPLRWEKAIDESGRYLLRCPVCGCRELFSRKDFNQRLGLGLVIAAGGASVFLFSRGETAWSLLVLGAAAALDAVVHRMTPPCLVCYRCRSEFRGVGIHESIEPWDLAVGEKYRPVRQAAEEGSPAGHSRSS